LLLLLVIAARDAIRENEYERCYLLLLVTGARDGVTETGI
jgi:hypothetical protein